MRCSDALVIEGPCTLWYAGRREPYYVLAHQTAGPLGLCVMEAAADTPAALQAWVALLAREHPALPQVYIVTASAPEAETG